MANVVIGSASAAIARDGVTHSYEEYGGDRVRMEDGSLRVTCKGRKNVWELISTLLTSGAAATLEAAIVATAPLTCSGDALGASFSCAGELLAKDRVPVAGGTIKYRVRFRLREI